MLKKNKIELKDLQQTVIPILILCIYTLVQYLLLKFINNQAVFILGTVPILIFSWWYGYKWTILIGFLIAAIQALLHQNVFHSLTPVVLISGTVATLTVSCIGVLLAHMKSLTRKVQEQLEMMKKAEKEKIDLQEQLHQSQKMEALGQMAGGIAHDFNNILGGISGYSELISIHFSHIDEKLAKYSTAIMNACLRAGEMTTNLLAFARKKRFELLPVDIHSLLINSIQLLQHTIDKRVSITYNLTASGFIVIGDSTQLQNCFINLALNSKDAMPDGGEIAFYTENVEIDEQFTKSRSFQIQHGPYVLIRVSDTGTGMEKEIADRAFDPFFTTKSQGKGTGLGLSIVFGFVKGHGGFIEIDSSPGNGCRMNMYLPIASVSISEHSSSESIRRGEGNILVIDDEFAIREVITDMLDNQGYKVATCEDGYKGIEYFRIHHKEIKLVILDLLMPGISGFDCLKKLKEIDNSVRILIVSGYSKEGEIEKIAEMGVTDFIKKPFTSTTLSTAIHNMNL